jgi:hypothetical protein
MKSLRPQKRRLSLKEHKRKSELVVSNYSLGLCIGDAVRNLVKNDQRQGGLLR